MIGEGTVGESGEVVSSRINLDGRLHGGCRRIPPLIMGMGEIQREQLER
jgi:hypothetical protein